MRYNSLLPRLTALLLAFAITAVSALALQSGVRAAEHADSRFAPLIPITGSASVSVPDAEIDYSHIDQGYVMCRYTGSADKAVVQISKCDGKTYTWHLVGNTGDWAFPLTQGDGRYQIAVWRRLTGTTYAQVIATTVDVRLDNEFLPFLYAGSMVDFDAESAVMAKGLELTEGMDTAANKADAIMRFVSSHIRYDAEKAANVRPGYYSDPDETLTSESGICVDHAVLAAAMLRSQGIPAKLVYGYPPDGGYHAWVSAYIGEWVDYDPSRSAYPVSGYRAVSIY